MKTDRFVIAEIGTKYLLPKFKVVPDEGLKPLDPNFMFPAREIETKDYQEITFVRGNKDPKGVSVEPAEGIVHESLLAMMIHDLNYKNTLVPARETSIAVTKLQEALMWLQHRQKDREDRDVQGTYQK